MKTRKSAFEIIWPLVSGLAHSEFGSSVNPIPTRGWVGSRLCPTHYWLPTRTWKIFLVWLSLTFKRVLKKCLDLTFKVNFKYQEISESFWKCFVFDISFSYWHFLITTIHFLNPIFPKWCSLLTLFVKTPPLRSR